MSSSSSLNTVSASSFSSSTDNNIVNSSNLALPLGNNPNSGIQHTTTNNKNGQSGFDIQQGLPLSKTIGIYDLPKNIILTDDFGKNNKIPILSLFLFKRLLEIIASNIDKSKNGNNMESNNIHRKSQLKGVIPNMMDEIKAALLLYSRSDIWNTRKVSIIAINPIIIRGVRYNISIEMVLPICGFMV